MLNSKTLSEVIKDPKKVLFHSKAKINLNFCDIETIDEVPKTYHKVEKFHVSHNKISKLTGIQQFKNITHLSLSYNQIKDWEELLKVENKKALVELNVKGNPFTAHPNHLYLIMELFPNLQRIDDLKISKEDRYYIQNYWLLSGRILPFYIQLKDDLAILEQTLQRMRLTAEVRQRGRDMSHKDCKENQERLEDLYYQMAQELKNEQLFIEIHRILEKYTRLQSQSPTLTLKILDTIIQSLYENRLEQHVFDRKILYGNYRKLFNDLMLRYFGLHDTSLDRFLTQRVLETPSYDHWKFADDNEYAFDCVLYEFYKLMPNQATISHNINFSFNDQQEHALEGSWGNPRNKVINTLDVAPNNPDFLRNLCITHFPIFPLNLQYNTMLLKMLLSQLEAIESVAVEMYLLLDANSPILKNLGSYRVFLESKMQQIRGRSQTPPHTKEDGQETENMNDTRSKRQTTSVPSTRKITERFGSPGTGSFALVSSDRKGGSYYLIPKSGEKDNLTSETRTRMYSQTDAPLGSHPERLTTLFGSGNKHVSSQTGRGEVGEMFEGKRKNVLPLMLIVKFDTNDKIRLKEGLLKLKEYANIAKKAERKMLVQEFYQNIRDKLDNNVKERIFGRWKARAKTKGKQLACFREIRHRRMERYFYLLKVGCVRSREETVFYYMKNLSLKVFYGILSLRMKKRAALKKIMDKYSQKRHRIVNLYLSKWRLVNSAMKYAMKKSKTMKNIHEMTATKKRQSSSDSRKYKDLKGEALRLQSKKTMRELEQYFGKDKDIFRKCSACDYDI